MRSKPKVDAKNPKQISHLCPEQRNVYIGAGPRLSLDQKITFINENNCLAKRITDVGNRNILSKNRSNSSLSNSSAGFKLPGINHKVGSLNHGKRRQEFIDITMFNLNIAKKLLQSKSVINYDSHAKHA